MRRTSFVLLIPLMLLTLLPGCRTRDFRTEADVLRGRVVEMEREILHLERRNRELRAEVERLSREADVPEQAAGQVPQMVELGFARFSHARDRTGDGMPNELRLYLHTLDGRGRFVQVTGEMVIDALLVPRDPAVEPVPIGTLTLAPEQLRDAYRSGFMGTHYTVRMPVEVSSEHAGESSPPDVSRVLVRAVFVDALTGLRHSADRTLEIREERQQRVREP